MVSGREPSELYLSAITLLEVELGITRASRCDAAQALRLQSWLEHDLLEVFRGRVLSVAVQVARRAARLHVPYPRPERDALIAATAVVHGLTVVTRNPGDFEPMGVALINPWGPDGFRRGDPMDPHTPSGYCPRMGTAIRRSREQSRHHAAHWAQPQQGALTYVALGDSAGIGVGVEDPARGYVGTIAQRLAEATNETVGVVNLCVSGAKAKDVLARQIPQLAEVPAPDFVTCVSGGNDVAWARVFRADEFGRDVEAIAAQLPGGAVMGTLPNFLHWPYERRAREANQAIRHAASQHGHALADIHALTKELTFRGYLRTFADDWFHPNEKGHVLWADAIWEQLSNRSKPTN